MKQVFGKPDGMPEPPKKSKPKIEVFGTPVNIETPTHSKRKKKILWQR